MNAMTLTDKAAIDAPADPKNTMDVKSILSRYGTVMCLLVVILLFGMSNDRFLSSDNITNVLQQSAVLAVLTTGLTLAVASGEFDLSTGAVASLAGILTTGLIVREGMPAHFAIGIAILTGIGVGLFNGLLVSLLRIPSLIATLGSSALAIGLNYAYSGGASVYGILPDSFKMLGQGQIGGIPVSVVTAAVVVLAGYLLLEKTKTGRYMVATGANPTSARLSGVRIKRYRMLGLVCSATLAAFAGIMLASYLGTGQPNGGDSYTLLALTVVFVGMSTIRPGQANMPGTLVGVVLLGVVANGLNLIGAEFWVQQMVTGAILITAVALAVIKEELRFF
jgi:simple sugar transport system permease protein/ribose transport system permease protein